MTRSSSTRSVAALLVVIGALLVTYGVALIFPPAGFIIGGLFCVAAGYVVAFFAARKEAMNGTP